MARRSKTYNYPTGLERIEPPRTKRHPPNSVERGPEIVRLYKLFIKPTTQELVAPEDAGTSEFFWRIEQFFGYPRRKVILAQVKEDFEMPGRTWRSEDEPHTLVDGVADPNVKAGSYVILRYDPLSPQRCEVQAGDTIFVMPQVKFEFVITKVVAIA